jgi:hypothetical protein
MKMKVKVGIVGENPQNDSEALRALLEPVAVSDIQFKTKTPLKNFKGGQLDGEKFFRSLSEESADLDWIILTRDLDGIVTEVKKIQEKERWFEKANKKAHKKGLFFLVIATMEALILSDIDTFNALYGVSINFTGDPLMKDKPKDFLISKTENSKKGKYDENHALTIFQTLKFKKVFENHKGVHSFQTFTLNLLEKNILDRNKLELLEIKLPPAV